MSSSSLHRRRMSNGTLSRGLSVRSLIDAYYGTPASLASLSVAGVRAYSTLADAEVLVIPQPGEPVRKVVAAFRTLMRETDAEEAFQKLMNDAHYMPGRIYGLCGIYFYNQSVWRSQAEYFTGLRTSVSAELLSGVVQQLETGKIIQDLVLSEKLPAMLNGQLLMESRVSRDDAGDLSADIAAFSAVPAASSAPGMSRSRTMSRSLSKVSRRSFFHESEPEG